MEDLVLDLLEFLLVGGTLDDELVLLLLQLRLLLGRHDAQQLVLHHARSTTVVTSVFIPGIFFFWGGRNSPTPERLASCVLLIFCFGQDDELRIYHGNVF